MEKVTLKAQIRKDIGRKVKLLRKEGVLPANIYGKKIKSESVQVDLKDFLAVYKKVGDTGLLYINERPVLVANVQKSGVRLASSCRFSPSRS